MQTAEERRLWMCAYRRKVLARDPDFDKRHWRSRKERHPDICRESYLKLKKRRGLQYIRQKQMEYRQRHGIETIRHRARMSALTRPDRIRSYQAALSKRNARFSKWHTLFPCDLKCQDDILLAVQRPHDFKWPINVRLESASERKERNERNRQSYIRQQLKRNPDYVYVTKSEKIARKKARQQEIAERKAALEVHRKSEQERKEARKRFRENMRNPEFRRAWKRQQSYAWRDQNLERFKQIQRKSAERRREKRKQLQLSPQGQLERLEKERLKKLLSEERQLQLNDPAVKEARNKKSRDYYHKNKSIIAARQKIYNKRHRKRRQAYAAKWKAAHPEKTREYYAKAKKRSDGPYCATPAWWTPELIRLYRKLGRLRKRASMKALEKANAERRLARHFSTVKVPPELRKLSSLYSELNKKKLQQIFPGTYNAIIARSKESVRRSKEQLKEVRSRISALRRELKRGAKSPQGSRMGMPAGKPGDENAGSAPPGRSHNEIQTPYGLGRSRNE